MIDKVHGTGTISPQLQTVENGGLDFAVWHWQGDGPRILLIHATGFHSRCWDQVVAHLPGLDCWAFDMRGHGLSSKPAPPYIWKNFGRDVVAIANKLNLQFATGVGHSMGGHSIALAAGLDDRLFKSLILIDPIIVQRKYYAEALTKEHPVQRRKNHWQSPEEMFERYTDKKPFDTWNKAVLKDYCQYGLIPSKSYDGLELACPSIVEGSIYNNSMDKEGADIYDEIAKIKARTLIMHPPLSPSKKIEDLIPVELGALFPNGEDELLPNLTHFIPMEAPQLVAERIKTSCRAL
jgi:pimeloyl-ACP methyl ester carboxylesterase